MNRRLSEGARGRAEGPALAVPGSLATILVAGALVLLATGCAPETPLPKVAPVVGAEEGPFGFRDPRVGLPGSVREGSREERSIVLALAALRKGDVEAARRGFAEGRKTASDPLPFELGNLYTALAAGKLEESAAPLHDLAVRYPRWLAAVEAEADLLSARGAQREALDRYRAALRLLPGDRRLTDRFSALRGSLSAARRREGEAALEAGDLEGARRAALSLLELEPSSPAGLQILSRTAAAAGKDEDAWELALKARSSAPDDRPWTEFTASLALRTGRFGEAAALFDGLGDAAKAETARLDFRIQNLPEGARRAAQSPRLTRAQLAVLAWWTVPEVRESAPAGGTADVAVDVVDRPERQALVRAINLGFFSVGRDSHRVGADAAVSRTELASILRRVARVAGRGRSAPAGCLGGDPPALTALVECGILRETGPRTVTGREALVALERAARMGREGGAR